MAHHPLTAVPAFGFPGPKTRGRSRTERRQQTRRRRLLLEPLESRTLLTTYSSADVPKTILDYATVTSTLAIADAVVISDLNVRLSITHTYDEDLTVSLQGPDNTQVPLFANVGGGGVNFTNTLLDDEAATAIAAGAAPFTGSFRPAGPLTAFDTKNAAGTWTLSVTDGSGGDEGRLTSWSLEITGEDGGGAPLLYLGTDQSGSKLHAYNLNTSVLTEIASAFTTRNWLEYSPAGVLYGAAGSSLYTIDPANGNATFVATLTEGATPIAAAGLTFKPDGTLYVKEYSNRTGTWKNILHTANVTTGALTPVAEITGTTGLYGLEYGDGVLYGAYDNALYAINTASGAATLLGTGVSAWDLDYGTDGVMRGTDQGSPGTVVQINLSTGAATTVTSSTTVAFWGLASNLPIAPAPDINVRGNGVNIADGDTTPAADEHTDFGGADVTSGTVTRTFTIHNTGSAALTLSGGTPVTVSGTDAADFSVTPPASATIAPGGSTTFQVTFNPSAAGTRTATVNIASDDPDENPYDFAIQGSGTSDGPSTYDSTDGPQALTGGTIISTLTVPAALTITDVNVVVHIDHTWDSDLNVYLIAPDSTRVELFTAVGGSGNNFDSTTLDDEAATAISAGIAPFSGAYRPEGLLSALDGKDAAGTWTLEITDTYPATDDGTLQGWSLTLAGISSGSVAPTGVDLAAASDTGASTTDDLTNLDNSTAGRTLQFTVSGTVGGATVTVYADGMPLGSAVADGTTTTVTTTGTTDLTDGVHAVTARQTESGKTESGDAPALSVTVDTVNPAVTVTQAAAQDDPTYSGPIRFTVVFAEPVTGFADGDVTLSGTAGATTATVSETAPHAGTTYQVAVSGMTAAGTVVASLGAGVAQDPAGNPNAASTGTDNGVTYDPTLPLIVYTLTPTGSGFAVQFNRPFDAAPLNLYDGAGAGRGPADVVVQDGAGHVVAGTMVSDAAARTLTFVKTGGGLAPATYTVTLKSGAAAFRDLDGKPLDGNHDGATGDDYTTQFVVAASSDRIVSVPDFARGAGQAVNVPSAGTGLPIRLDDADGVTSLAVDVVYDETLLEVTAAAMAVGLPGDWTVVNPPDTSTPGVAKIRASGTTPLSGTNVEVVRLTAVVPNAAPYGASQAIRLESVLLNGGAIAAVGDVAVHKAAYLGDADGSGIHSSADAFLTVQAALGLASGFAAHAWTDPRIVGDADGSGLLSAADAFLIVQEGLGMTEPFVPDNPHIGVTHVGGGIDPRFQIGGSPSAEPGATVTVPIQLDVEAAATNVGGIDFELFFDPVPLTLTVPGGVSAGADTACGWAVTSTLVAAGHLRVALLNARGQALATGLREIARVQFHVAETAAAGLDGLETHPTLTDGLETHPTLMDGLETHPTLMDLEPVDAHAGGYAWTATDGSIAIVVPNAWHNGANPFDVDGNGTPAPADALALINYINGHPGEVGLRATGLVPHRYLDVTNDRACTAADVLAVINELNAAALAGAEGEGAGAEPAASRTRLEDGSPSGGFADAGWRSAPVGHVNAAARTTGSAADFFFRKGRAESLPLEAVLGEFAEDVASAWSAHA